MKKPTPDRIDHFTMTGNDIEMLGPLTSTEHKIDPKARLAQAILKRRIRVVLKKHGSKKES